MRATPRGCCAGRRGSRPSPSLTLALGIGANSAIFTVVHAVLLRPLPYPEPDRLVGIVQQHTSFGPEFATWPDYTDWRDRSVSVERLGGAWTRVFNLTGIEEPERLVGRCGDGDPVRDARRRAAARRARSIPTAREIRASVVLSHRLWQRRFGEAADVVGRTVSLNGTPHTVIGVMPPGFAWPESAELWVPLVRRSQHGPRLPHAPGRGPAAARCDADRGARGARHDRGGVRGRLPGIQQGLGRCRCRRCSSTRWAPPAARC